MTECFLSDQEIRKLNRDLRILIAANGTLTRVLNIVADDEVIVQIVKQRIHDVSPKLSEFEQLGQVGVGRVLQRYIILKGRNSEHLFVAAESLIAIDRLPACNYNKVDADKRSSRRGYGSQPHRDLQGRG